MRYHRTSDHAGAAPFDRSSATELGRHCREVQLQLCELDGTPKGQLAAVLLEDADTIARWRAAGKTATESVQRELMGKGIGYVYERDGEVRRRLPGGTDVPIKAA